MTAGKSTLVQRCYSIFFAGSLAALIGGLLFLGLSQWGEQPNGAATPQLPGEKAENPPATDSNPPSAGAAPSVAFLEALRRKNVIINAHEHVESIGDAPKLLEAMKQAGIGLTVLVGSSNFTLVLRESVGFTGYDENNEELLKFVKQFPGKFEAWVTLNPLDEDNFEKLQRYVAQGATGVKLYLGHGYTRRDNKQYMFHTIAMDDPRMAPIYAYCAENFVPLCYHVNPAKPGFAQEIIAVLEQFPDLKVNLPHYILSSINQTRLREFLDVFPNVYSDISFGHDDFLRDGLERISNNVEKFRALFHDYPTRFFFGTDLVMTRWPGKTVPWYLDRVQTYYDMLTRETYTTPLLPGRSLRGLALDNALLENLLYKNYQQFKEKKPKGTKPSRPVRWENIGVPRLNRSPGQAIPAAAP